MKRILIGVVLTIVFYFAGCFLTGAVAGAAAGAKDPQNASAAGARAGYEAVMKYRGMIAIAAVAFGALSACAGRRPRDEVAGQPGEDAWPATHDWP